MLLVDRILAAAEATPEAPAFINADVPMSYRGMRSLLSVAVKGLHGQAISAGEPVALTMSQSPLHLVTFLALARLGALVVPASPFLRPAERAALIRKYGVATVITDRADMAVPGTRLLLLQSIAARGGESSLDVGAFTPAPESPLRLALTSGTTGPQRGTLQTQERFMRRVERTRSHAGERQRFIPPNLHSTSALTQAMQVLCDGGTVVFPRGYDNEPFFEAIRAHGVTHVALPAAHLALMLAALPDEGPAFASIASLRFVGGSPPAALLDRARRRFSPNVYVSYGVGEIGRLAIAGPEVLAKEPRSAGPPLPDVRFEVIDPEGNALPRGSRGEVRAAIEGMPTSYYGPDAADRSRFRDGWFYPGDVARLSAEGLIFVEGRIDDVINIGGRKVAPRFVESYLEEFPGVREAAVFVEGEGAAGPRVAAAIVSSAAVEWHALARRAGVDLDVCAPARYIEVESLPRNAAGKLLRAELAAWAEAHGKPR